MEGLSADLQYRRQAAHGLGTTGPPTQDVAILYDSELLAEINVTTAKRFSIKDDYVWIETIHWKLRMKATWSDLTHERVVSIPHGWWLSETTVSDRGAIKICSNVFVDGAIENCDVVLDSNPLKVILGCISRAEPPRKWMVEQRWGEATLSATPVEQEIAIS